MANIERCVGKGGAGMVQRWLKIGCSILLLLVVPSGRAFGQESTQKLEEEIQALKRGQEEIFRQLQEIKQLIQARQVAPVPASVRDVPVDLKGHPIQGSETAKVTLVEFSDYQCPYCGRHARETHPQIEKQYIQTGKLRYVFFDMPLESIHKFAFKAAQAARCAEAQGKFWQMHDRLFANQQALEPWSVHAKALGLDVPKFDACVSSNEFVAAIRQDMAVAQKLGVAATPSFLFALTDPKDPERVTGLTLLRGAQPFSYFKTEIDKALAAAAQGK
jgi:protein-disulfide isomerase